MTGSMASSNTYKCRDGEYIVIACGEPQFWRNLCRALEREDLLFYHSAPEDKQEQGIKEMSKIFLTRTRDEWFAFLKDKDTCVAPVNSIEEALDDPQLRHRGMVLEIDHETLGKVTQIGFPVKLSDTPARLRNLGKVVGFDTQRIMEELGYSREDIRGLVQQGAIE
jgi:crotonobetainyl-CoA:carnitine CoA-transferase CaiB-like acyl-CoA transferase